MHLFDGQDQYSVRQSVLKSLKMLLLTGDREGYNRKGYDMKGYLRVVFDYLEVDEDV